MVKLPFNDLQNLPDCAAEFIKLVIKKMRYQKKARADVMAELIAHFEDELACCTTAEEKGKRAQQLIDEFGNAKLLATLCRRAKKTLPTSVAKNRRKDFSGCWNNTRFFYYLHSMVYDR